MPKREDVLLLQDLYEAGNKVLLFTAGYSFDDYMLDVRTMDAVIRNFEIIGEASRNLSSTSVEANRILKGKS